MKNTYAYIAFIASLFFQTASYSIQAPKPPITQISGKGWAYTVDFPVKNKDIIEKLIQCESQGKNIARMDSNGLISYGILQFNGSATWASFAPRAGVSSGPMDPASAIRVADFMIDHGQLHRWTCASILHLD
jgi:hypothetical protein